MSFILDALKKSESERQQQGSAEFAQVPIGRDSARAPIWLWILGVLLAINVLVLLGVLLRPAPERLATPPLARDDFTEKVELAMREPAPELTAPQIVDPMPSEPAVRAQPALSPPATRSEAIRSTTETNTSGIPDIDQLRESGELSIGELRLDIHVFSEVPADRFVFINMSKYREGAKTSDGMTVDRITPDGVTLTYRGRQFLLPRQ